MLFHHDPYHSDDELDAIYGGARELWQELGGAPGAIEMAAEQREIEVVSDAPQRASA